jgi:hypothetical protein
MPQASTMFWKRAIAVDTAAWQPVVAPIACNTWVIRADAPINTCSDTEDPTTFDTLAVGVQEGVLSSRGGDPRFPVGITLLFVQAQSGSTTVHATFSI